MSVPFLCRRLCWIGLLLGVVGCASLGPPAALLPEAFRGPSSDDPSPELVVDGPPVQTLPRGTAGPIGAATPALPSPSPTPTQLVFDAFLIKALPTWRVEQAQTAPSALRLRSDDGSATLRIEGQLTSGTLEAHQAQAEAEAGPGLITTQIVTLDELRGYLVAANRDTADGRRYVVERGFRYRGQLWRIVTAWDKAAPSVDRAITDVETMLRSFRWM